MKKLLIQLDGYLIIVMSVRFFWRQTIFAYVGDAKGKSYESMLIYKLLGSELIRKGPINLKRETMESLKNFKDEI